MAVIYTDKDIAEFFAERKALPSNWASKASLLQKRGHSQRHLDCRGESGSSFRIILRQSLQNSLDFSAILAIRVPQSNRMFRLRRYNGKSHTHTNTIEGQSFYDYHVHFATERYQLIGAREDAYAETNSTYFDLNGAISLLIKQAEFEVLPDSQPSLF